MFIKQLKYNLNLITNLVFSDFRKRFVGSYFGVIWLFVQPITTILIYFFIFELGFHNTPPVDAPYILWLIPGIIPWFYINEAITAGTNCLTEYHYLVKKMVFHIEFLPIIKVLSSFLVHLIFVFVTLCVFLIYGRTPLISWIQVIYYSIAALIFSLAIVYFSASINVFFKDITQLISIALQFGMWLTPIMWDPIMFPNHPEWLIPLLKFNPVYYIVTGYRDSLLSGNFFWERPLNTVYFWSVTGLIFFLDYRLFMKLRPHFADIL